ncbi:MAG: hypothetical protein NC820_07065 [Candidatus Omnitrophica bacterium]|nr:hypothetical protein [Candidatus Omnitrophota bacterium]
MSMIYSTGDYRHAAYLYHKKCILKDTKKDSKGRVIFTFEDKEDREDLLRALYERRESSKVFPIDFFADLDTIKDILWEVKNRKKEEKENE